MALVIADRVREQTTTTGTGAVTLTGAVAGYQSFSVVGNANSTYYAIVGPTTEWEVGIGTYTASGTTLSRDTVLSSSNSGSLVSFSAGTKDVIVTQPSEKSGNPIISSTTSVSTLTPNINAYNMYVLTALSGSLTVAAPTGSPVDGDKLIFRILDNGTSQTLTWNVTYTAIGVTIPGATTVSKTLYVGCLYNANNTRWDVVSVAQQI